MEITKIKEELSKLNLEELMELDSFFAQRIKFLHLKANLEASAKLQVGQRIYFLGKREKKIFLTIERIDQNGKIHGMEENGFVKWSVSASLCTLAPLNPTTKFNFT